MAGTQWCPGCQKVAPIKRTEQVIGTNRVVFLTCAICGIIHSTSQIPLALPRRQEQQIVLGANLNEPTLIIKNEQMN